MLGIILTYFSFPEMLPYQLSNFKKFVNTPYTVFIIDDSDGGLSELNIDGVTYFRHTNHIIGSSASIRHQTAVNFGLKKAERICNSFLIFDNDMIFLNDFNPPSLSYYRPQFRGKLEYSWLNLLYLTKVHTFDFKKCSITGQRSDSGGNYVGDRKIIDICDHGDVKIKNDHLSEYVSEYNELCRKNAVPIWYDILDIKGSIIFHFCAVSNWKNWSEHFQIEKKRLIMKYLKPYI